MPVSVLEELEQIADAFTKENNTEKLVELSNRLLATLDRVEAQQTKSEFVV
jgi:hypothetical protein